MGTSRSAEEVLAEYQRVLGEEFGTMFHALSGELTWTYWRWSQYEKLFGSKESRVEIMNEAAPFFFHIIQQTLWWETLLGVSRLAGPDRSVGRDNLAVRRVLRFIEPGALYDRVKDRVDEMDTCCSFVTPWRHKYIAHRDLQRALDATSAELPSATRERVVGALRSIAAVMNEVELGVRDSTTAYDFVDPIQDADSMLFYLRSGLIREREKREKLKRGEYDPRDFEPDSPEI